MSPFIIIALTNLPVFLSSLRQLSNTPELESKI
jgi:hypothetical protein